MSAWRASNQYTVFVLELTMKGKPRRTMHEDGGGERRWDHGFWSMNTYISGAGRVRHIFSVEYLYKIGAGGPFRGISLKDEKVAIGIALF
jgi:hypothetical protein